MHLQRGRRIIRRDRPLDSLGNDGRFRMPKRQQQTLSRLPDRTNAHGDAVAGDKLLPAKESSVVLARLLRERLDAGAGSQGGCRFVKSDVANIDDGPVTKAALQGDCFESSRNPF
jgi:hypothetical protein